MLEKFKQSLVAASEFGPIATFFTFFQGRCTTFAIFFALVGVIMAGVGIWGFIHGKDLSSFASFISSYALFVGAIFTGLVAHSVKEDWMSLKQSTSVTTASPDSSSSVTTVSTASSTSTVASATEEKDVPSALD